MRRLTQPKIGPVKKTLKCQSPSMIKEKRKGRKKKKKREGRNKQYQERKSNTAIILKIQNRQIARKTLFTGTD